LLYILNNKLRSSRSRILAFNPANKSVKPMKELSLGKKHVRAFARHNFDSMGLAELKRLRADRSSSYAAVHPNPFDSNFRAIFHRDFCDGWRGHEQHSLDGWLNFPHTREAVPAKYFGSSRIYRDHVIAASAKFREQLRAEIRKVARNSYHCDSVLPQEFIDDLQI
jgi:hypothetical protein